MNYQTNINRLRYFKTLCKHGSVSKAAEELHLSQPSLSVAIKELEQELGIELFFRVNNRLKLTEPGKVVLDKANDILQQMDDFFNDVAMISKHEIANVKLGVPPIMGTVLVPGIYSGFVQSNPFIELEMLEYTYHDALIQLEDNHLDLAIMILNDYVRANYNYETFYDTELHFCVGKGNPLSKKKMITCCDLKEFPLTILSTGSFHNSAINQMFQKAGIKPHIVYQTVQLSTITSLVENYKMGTFIYKDVFFSNPNIVTIPCENTEKIRLCVAWKRHRNLTFATESVIKFLLAYKTQIRFNNI
jgi:DNA-binding transcriptional LysR family regulator